jgi:hypothetical protein
MREQRLAQVKINQWINQYDMSTYVVVHKLDLWQGEGVVEGHEDGWLHQDINHVHGCMPKEER